MEIISGMITKKMIKVLKQYVDFCEYQRGVTDEVLYNNIIKLANTDKEMTADKTLTKEEFVEKYKYGIDPVYGNIVNKKEECLSDLNALLRSELIKYEDYSHKEFYETISSEDEISFYTKQVDEYLKSQQ
jgi:hypothetical protein